MTTAVLERPPTHDRSIPLTAEQIAELDATIEAMQFGQIDPKCVFTMMACIDFIVCVLGGGNLGADGVDEDFVDMRGDEVRLIRPSLAQLLDARRRAVLKR